MKTDLIAASDHAVKLKKAAQDFVSYDLSEDQVNDLELLMSGTYAPLRGYLNETDHLSVLNSMRLNDGKLWAKPISLATGNRLLGSVSRGDQLALRNPEGVVLAILSVEDSFMIEGLHYLGGTVEGIEMPTHYDHKELRLNLSESNLKADAVLVCTGLLHRSEIEAVKAYMDLNEVLVSIQLFVDDPIESFFRLRCIKAALSELPEYSFRLSVLPGKAPKEPKEWLQHAISVRNYGCSALLSDGDLSLVREHSKELEVEAVSIPTGSPENTFDSVTNEIQNIEPPRSEQGLTVFFTGLSGSGKSTIANILQIKILGLTEKRITLLDGDLVRQNLCSELGFSKEHRNINVRRIGFVANEISKNGGIAICAPIAPYDSVRQEIRNIIEPESGFILVYVATPLEECEARDRKGLYAKARSGEIKQFTGISDTYEKPTNADIVIQTTTQSAEDATDSIIQHLKESGYLELA